MQLSVLSHTVSNWTVLTVAGELDVMGAPVLRQQVLGAVGSGATRFVIDLSGVDFVDSFGLGVLIGALKRARLRDGTVELVCPDDRLRRIFEICDLDRVFTLHRTVEAAAGLQAVEEEAGATQ